MSTFNNQTRKQIYGARRTTARSQSICGSYAAFESAKSAWREQHPGATTREYELAVMDLAKRYKV
jgi:hypothetical protein